MKKQNNEGVAIPTEMAKAIYQNMTKEERIAALKETADQVVKHSYSRPYSEEKITERRAELSELCIKISDLERELAAQKAHYKALITPLENDKEEIISDLRSGGEWVTEDCYVFLNFNIGKAGLYNEDGILLNEAEITPEMSQSTIFQSLREDPEDQDQNEPEVPLLEAPENE